jgi:phage repressor protein C with HTH and peptisase S24 domain
METEKLYADFAARVELAVAQAGGPSEVARKMHVTLPTLTRWRTGNADPSRTNLVKLADATGVDLAWLATGKGEMRDNARLRATHAAAEPQMHYGVAQHQEVLHEVKDTLGNPVDLADFVFIPRYAAKASAGHGADTQNCCKPLFSMAFRRYWIKHYLRADPANLAVISAKGDSMDGVLNDRDAILIDLSDVTPTGGLYVVRLAGDLMVKRVQKMPGGRFLLLSANPAYVPAEVDPAQEADFAVVGRVVWFGRQV